MDQPKWGVGSRWPYLMGPDDPMIQNYTALMVATAISMGTVPSHSYRELIIFGCNINQSFRSGAPRERAERDMKEAMELELKLVNFSAEEMVR